MSKPGTREYGRHTVVGVSETVLGILVATLTTGSTSMDVEAMSSDAET